MEYFPFVLSLMIAYHILHVKHVFSVPVQTKICMEQKFKENNNSIFDFRTIYWSTGALQAFK